MEKYKVNWAEVKTGRSGKKYVEMNLVNESGVAIDKVSTFELSYAPGMEIEGTIVKNGSFKNFKPKLEPPAFIKGNPNYKTMQMEKVMDKKSESIKGFQASKDESIMWSSCFRDATLLTIAEKGGKEMSEYELQGRWLAWREWLLNRFKNDNLEDIIPPFIEK